MIDPHELVGRNFLVDKEDGQRHRARIVEAVKEHEDRVDDNNTSFKCSLNNDEHEELFSYNQVMDFIEKEEGKEILWKFKRIVGHQGPLSSNHPDYKGSAWNVRMEWENNEITAEPLNVIAADDPVTCAIYAKDHGLLNLPGWRRFKGIAKRHKKMIRMANQAKLRSFRTAPRCKYGYGSSPRLCPCN